MPAREKIAAWLLATCVAGGLTAPTVASPAVPGPPAPADPEKVEFFEKKVRPVLADHCYKCHGPQGKVKGGLRLDSAAGMTKGGTSGPVVVAGDPDASLLVKAVRYGDPDLQMPPKDKLPDAAVASIVAWVKMGAPLPTVPAAGASAVDWKRHWAFLPPRASPLPAIARAGWALNEVDRFILAKLEEKGLGPSPAADKITLIRRATFDLT